MGEQPTPLLMRPRARQAPDGGWFRLLVTGSREWADEATVERQLIRVSGEHGGRVIVVHGACPDGLDKITDRVARRLGLRVERNRANWEAPCRPSCRKDHRRRSKSGGTYCPAAGDYRNQDMVDKGAGECLAFFWAGAGNQGTSDCAARAKRAGIPVNPVQGGSGG